MVWEKGLYSDMNRCDLPINYPKFNKFNERKRDHVWRKKKWAVRNTGSGECTEKRKSQPEN